MDVWGSTSQATWAYRTLRAASWTALLALALTAAGTYLLLPTRGDDLRAVLRGSSLTDGLGAFLGYATGLWAAFLTLSLGAMRQRSRKRRRRTTLRGTQLVRPRWLERTLRGDGLGIPYLQSPSWIGRLLGGRPTLRFLRIPRLQESSHLLLCGDSGAGKSVLMHHFLHQLRARGDTAVVYDPAREFYQVHARPGDILLDPTDARCPYWCLASELAAPGSDLALARSFLPGEGDAEKNFFVRSGRTVLAFLLRTLRDEGQDTQALYRWLSSPQEVTQMVKGTPLESVLPAEAPEQQQGVLGTLSLIADALRSLPPRDGRAAFSLRSWSAGPEPRPWLFLANRYETREVLKPLIAVWLDTLFRRFLGHEVPGVWVFLDELRTLERLPSFRDAQMEGRKFQLKIVSGFQGRAQLEATYGKEAETLMSTPATRLFLRTQEYGAAKWAAENIGVVEQERGTESVTTVVGPGRDSISHGTERRVDYLVLPTEVQNLEPLSGYLRVGPYATKIAFAPLTPCRVPGEAEERLRPGPMETVPLGASPGLMTPF